MSDVVVVGGGVGGMAAAIRLRAAGHRVVLCERGDVLGGKLAERRRDGFGFDLGPSLLTWPEIFDELLGVTGYALRDLVDLVPVDPIMRYRFVDGSGFAAYTDPARTAADIDAMAPGEGERWTRYLEWARTCWQASLRTFLAGPADRLGDLRGTAGAPTDALATDPLRTLASRARHAFRDPRMQMYVMRYATYSGSDPYRAPAALGCIPFLEHHHGAWYVVGGLVRLRDALARVLAELDVDVRTGTEVRRILVSEGAVSGVELVNGATVRADVVITDVDARVVYDALLASSVRYRGRRTTRSTSGFLVLAGVQGRTADLAHHNLYFGGNYRREFADITRRRQPPQDPSIYLGCSVVDDVGRAPAGDENWTLLVNVPAGDPATWAKSPKAYGDQLFARLAERGLDVSDRLRFVETMTPADIARRDGSGDGAIYGTAYHGRLAPLHRPGNRGPFAGLYLLGGSTHPGGGLPLVVRGAHIVSDLVAAERGSLDVGAGSRGGGVS